MSFTTLTRRTTIAAAIAAGCAFNASAQDPMAGMNMPRATDTTGMSGPLGISMERLGSGTTWIPDAVTLPSKHFTIGKWNGMLHGFAFLQYDRQDGPRGSSQFGSLNWGMLMGTRKIGAGWLQDRKSTRLNSSHGYISY